MRGLRLWGPVLLWCLAIFAFSSMPDLSTGLAYDYPLRKGAHAGEYAVLFLLLRRALVGTWGAGGFRGGLALLLSSLYAMTDEYHQSFVPGRCGCWSDVGIDAAGAALAACWGPVRRALTRAS